MSSSSSTCREETDAIEDSPEPTIPTRASSALGAVTRAAAKKARTHDLPRNSFEADTLLRDMVRQARLCKACMCRDAVHAAVDEIVDCLQHLPQHTPSFPDDFDLGTLTVYGDDDNQDDVAFQFAMRIIKNCQAASAYRNNILSRAAVECNELCAGRLVDVVQVPVLVRHTIATTLPQVPYAIVDILMSYVDAVQEFVDPPFLRSVFRIYLGAIKQYTAEQQLALQALERRDEEHRSSQDAQRDHAASCVVETISCASVLTSGTLGTLRVQRPLQVAIDHINKLRRAPVCFHSVAQSKLDRARMELCHREVVAMETNLKNRGFLVTPIWVWF